jgi:hypothetical protein
MAGLPVFARGKAPAQSEKIPNGSRKNADETRRCQAATSVVCVSAGVRQYSFMHGQVGTTGLPYDKVVFSRFFPACLAGC